MKISRLDMQKLRNVSQDETLELILKDIGIEIEPKPILPDITQGVYRAIPMDGQTGWKVVSDAVSGDLAQQMRKADAMFYASTPEIAQAGHALLKLVDEYGEDFLEMSGTCLRDLVSDFRDALRDAGVDMKPM